MPVMDGMEATRAIRNYEAKNKTKRVHIIALTGLTSASARLEAWSAGVDHYMSKPINFKELEAVLMNERSEALQKQAVLMEERSEATKRQAVLVEEESELTQEQAVLMDEACEASQKQAVLVDENSEATEKQ
jgi:DNA-binding response OmpR family regulator